MSEQSAGESAQDTSRLEALRELMGSIGSVAQAGAEADELETTALELPDAVLDRATEIERARTAD